jgi:hypothetical protein
MLPAAVGDGVVQRAVTDFAPFCAFADLLLAGHLLASIHSSFPVERGQGTLRSGVRTVVNYLDRGQRARDE